MEKTIEIQPFNEIWYKDCFHMALFPILKQKKVEKEFCVHSVSKYQLDALYFDFSEEEKRVYKLDEFFEDTNRIQIGLACKTWGNGKRLKVNFYDFKIC